MLWSAKEAVFKWYGAGSVDFSEHIQLGLLHTDSNSINCFFAKTDDDLEISYRVFDQLVLSWVMS